jgi:hypothetical protein
MRAARESGDPFRPDRTFAAALSPGSDLCVAAIAERREPNSIVTSMLDCHRVLNDFGASLRARTELAT